MASDCEEHYCKMAATTTLTGSCIHEHIVPYQFCDFHAAQRIRVFLLDGVLCWDCMIAGTPNVPIADLQVDVWVRQ